MGKFRIGFDPALNTPEEYGMAATNPALNISPNPVNAIATVTFDNAVCGQVQVTVYDLLGNKILTALDEEKAAGRISVLLNGKSFANGAYICRVHTTGGEAASRFVVIR